MIPGPAEPAGTWWWVWGFGMLVFAMFLYEAAALISDTHHPGRPTAQGVTISAILRRWFRNPLVLFSFGMLCGHLVWCG